MHTNYPCSGFDAAVSYLCIQIENRMNETHKPFDEQSVSEHLKGIYTIGTYPLLDDNTSYFIAEDLHL